MFLYLGLGLILLALICLPVRVRYIVEPEVMEYEQMPLGPAFTFLIGFWAFGSLVLGVTESSMSKRAVLLCLVPVICLVNIVSASLLWLQAVTFGGLSLSGWVILGLFLLLPTILTNIVGFFYLMKRAELTRTLNNLKVRVVLLTLLATVPSFFAIALFMNVITYF